jgi:hypothetical protein
MLEALTPALQNGTISPQDRFNLQTDVYALARAGHIGYVEYLKLLRDAYKREENLTVWKSILRQLTELGSIFEYAILSDTKPLYQVFLCDLLSTIHEKLGWDALPNEHIQSPMLRSLILTHLGIHEDPRIKTEASRRFQHFIRNASERYLINPNIRAAIYLTVAKTGDEQTFQHMKTVRPSIMMIDSILRFSNI